MKPNVLKFTTCALSIVALLILASCKSKLTGETASVAAFRQGVPGGTIVQTHQITAKVTAIDTASRKVALETADGKKTTVKCGPEIINFDQIRVGDQLKVVAAEELAVYMATDAAPPADGATAVVALAPKGAKPAGIVASTVQVTATVTAIDSKHHKATLQFPDGTTHTVAVRPDVDLNQRKVGEQVVIRTTEALAISVEKE